MIFVNIVCHSRKNPRCILAQKLLSQVLSGLEKRKLFDSLLRVRMRHQNTSHDYFFSTNNVYVVILVSEFLDPYTVTIKMRCICDELESDDAGFHDFHEI